MGDNTSSCDSSDMESRDTEGTGTDQFDTLDDAINQAFRDHAESTRETAASEAKLSEEDRAQNEAAVTAAATGLASDAECAADFASNCGIVGKGKAKSTDPTSDRTQLKSDSNTTQKHNHVKPVKVRATRAKPKTKTTADQHSKWEENLKNTRTSIQRQKRMDMINKRRTHPPLAESTHTKQSKTARVRGGADGNQCNKQRKVVVEDK